MRIGVDACCWANGRGYGRFTRELLKSMVAEAPEDEFVCFVDARADACFQLKAPNLRTVCVAQSASPTLAASADGNRTPVDMLRFTHAVSRERLDVFFSPSVYTYFPLPPFLPAVVAIHDTIAERYPELTLPSRRARLFWGAKVKLALQQARLIMTVSDFSAGEIVQRLGVTPDRLRVVPEAPAPEFRPSEDRSQIDTAAKKYGLPSAARWFTYVGGFNPHKRLDVLVRAHAAVARRSSNPPYLLLVGTTDGDVFHGNLAAIRQTIVESGTEPLVRWTGFVPDGVLRHLHSGAIALILASECEGFGLPAVEAAACGTPVIATTASPLPDLISAGGLFIAPGDEAALANAMATLLCDDKRRWAMGERGREQVNRLSWKRSGELALATIREAAA